MGYMRLPNEVVMPYIGFGVFQIGDLRECQRAVESALEVGYRLLDTAASYDNEQAVGEAVKTSGLAREDVFITSKAYIHQMGYDKTMRAFEESCEKLQTDYLDLYLIHMPLGDYYGSWRAIEELYGNGRIRAIGVSNFSSARLLDLCKNADIKPMVDQIEHHPHFQRAEEIRFMRSLDVQPQGWAPFAEGMHGMFDEPALRTIADKHGKTPAQVILRWDVQTGVPTIPKSTHAERMEENIDVFDFELDDEDMELIAALDTGRPSMLDVDDPKEVERVYGYMENPVVTSLN
ncbi:aldo/keto reductase [Slackia isoflavoniconvertens]|uniref:2,5-diketo-D-gluconic acid reductase n=1 Tax=Slackia isoflavoniconvertens TaxID=572010 RepID=A0A369LFQ0_9ACTN|nr:aldo/keto reductase [Slackia isoflavoniconvertens]RDB58014.1 2,5-diketo-D-gluconic acid reductase [Slackia isoflavoniconvertens]